MIDKLIRLGLRLGIFGHFGHLVFLRVGCNNLTIDHLAMQIIAVVEKAKSYQELLSTFNSDNQ